MELQQVISVLKVHYPKWWGQFLRSVLVRALPRKASSLLIAASQKAACWQFYARFDKSSGKNGGSEVWRAEKKERRVGGKKKVSLNCTDWMSISFFASREVLSAVISSWISWCFSIVSGVKNLLHELLCLYAFTLLISTALYIHSQRKVLLLKACCSTAQETKLWFSSPPHSSFYFVCYFSDMLLLKFTVVLET